MRVTTAVMVLALSLATGCSGAAPNGAPTVVAPTGTGPVSLPDRPAAITAVEASSTVPAATEGSVPATAGATHLSPDGPWRLVASAPGIQSPGLVYELMPRLWVFLPSEQDLAHGVVWTFHERDREVIEDWLRAMVVYYRGVTVDPMRIEGDEWATWFPSRDMPMIDLLEQRRSNHQHLELDAGMVLRPEVLGEQRSDTTAFVFNCELDGTIIVDGSGAIVPPSFRGWMDDGMGYRMQLVDGAWRVMAIGSQDDACA